MKPYFQDESVTIYHGDCRDVVPNLPRIDTVISDPPYGMNYNTDNSRFKPGPTSYGGHAKNWGVPIVGDEFVFNPTPWLEYPTVILWGANHYAQQLPRGTTLVYLKRNDDAFGSFLSDAEIGWMNRGFGVYCFRVFRDYDKGKLHPAEKPIGLMTWCLERAKPRGMILDPYMGSGTTLRAAKNLGFRAIGIEIEERYCEIAANRMAQQVLVFEPQHNGPVGIDERIASNEGENQAISLEGHL